MKHPAILFFCLFALAACGIDGAPTAPAAEPGVTMTGTVKVGVVGN